VKTKKRPVNNSHTVVAEEAAEDVEVVVVAPEVEVVLVAVPASNVEKRVISQEIAPRNSHLVANLEEVVVDREEVVKPDPELVTNVEKKVTMLVTALRRRKEKETTPVAVEEAAVLSEDKDLELAMSVEKKDITPVTVHLSRLLPTMAVVDVLSVDPNLELVMSAEKKAITFATVLRKKDKDTAVVTTPTSSALPVTRWVTCLVTAPKEASPNKEVVTASTATSLVTWPETALKVVIPVAAVVEVVSVEAVEATDLPAHATDAERRDISSPIAPSLTPEVKKTKKFDRLTL